MDLLAGDLSIPESENDPITLWIEELRGADEAAATKLWNHYFVRLRDVAKEKLRADTRSIYDEDDAALSGFHSFCAGIAAGRFPDLKDRESLWGLLLVITSRKVSRRHRHDQQQRRDQRRTVMEPVFGLADESASIDIHHLLSREPSPEFAAEFTETCNRFFDRLGDPKLVDIALLRIEGYNDAEIAARLNCVRSTVQRRLNIIRRECEALEEPEE